MAQTTDLGNDQNLTSAYSTRMEFLKTQLQLTAHEDSVFFPVYKPFYDQMTDIRNQNKGIKTKGMNLDSIPDDLILNMLQQQILLAQREANLKEEFLNKFLEVLPVKKVARLYQLEKANTPNIKTINNPGQQTIDSK